MSTVDITEMTDADLDVLLGLRAESRQARFERLLARRETPAGRAAVAAHKAAGEAYALANPTRALTRQELAMREALAGSDDGWGDFCSPVRGDV